jgi:hypothetical protein
MAHYAFLDQNNVVINVITGRNEGEKGLTGEEWEAHYTLIQGNRCLRTSYNTRGGQHKAGGVPFRKNYAGSGYFYDENRDAFVPPQPYASWLLNENSCLWEPPIPMPNDGQRYKWNEATQSWVKL